MSDLYDTDPTLAIALEQMESQRIPEGERQSYLTRWFGVEIEPVEAVEERVFEMGVGNVE